jgi:lauroyl/myristoyl acyltransferase
LLTVAAGHACVFILTALGSLPPKATRIFLSPFLFLYPRLRPAHCARLSARFAASPFRGDLEPARYYAMRLRLLLSGLCAHVRRTAADGAATVADLEPEGWETYLAALASDRPIALIGLHAGPWEELHRVPPAREGRPFLILTAPAFSPPLTAFMAKGRESGGKSIIWIGSDGKRGLAAGIRAVQSGRGILALMADQHPDPGEEEWLSLWDRIRIPYPARLLRSLAAHDFLFMPVSIRISAEGTPLYRFHSPWDSRDIAGESADIGSMALAAKVRDFLETAIAVAPDQWNWSYPKIRPALS